MSLTCILCLEAQAGLVSPFACACRESVFCQECWRAWMRNSGREAVKCPVCRQITLKSNVASCTQFCIGCETLCNLLVTTLAMALAGPDRAPTVLLGTGAILLYMLVRQVLEDLPPRYPLV